MLPYAEATARPRRYREFWLLAALCLLGLFPSTDPNVVLRFGFLANHPTWYSWLTCQFLHAGWAHFFGNFWMLWIFGPTVAAQLGVFFLPFYFLGGAVAAVVCVGLDQASAVPMIGASGAIAAVMGYYMVVFPRSRLRVLSGGGFGIPMDVSAFLFVGMFLAAETVAWLNVSRGYHDAVAHLAHLGGLGLGIFVGLCSPAPSRLREAVTDSGPVAQAEDEGEEELAVQGYVAKIEKDVDFRLDPARELTMVRELLELGFDALAQALLARLSVDAQAPPETAALAASLLAELRPAEAAAATPAGPPVDVPAARLVDRFSVSAAGIFEDGGAQATPWADCLLIAAYGLRQDRLKTDDGLLDVDIGALGTDYHDVRGLQPVLELVLMRPWRRLRWAPDPADQPGGQVLDMFFQGAGELLANVIVADVNDGMLGALRRRIPKRCVFDSEDAAEGYLAGQMRLALANKKRPS